MLERLDGRRRRIVAEQRLAWAMIADRFAPASPRSSSVLCSQAPTALSALRKKPTAAGRRLYRSSDRYVDTWHVGAVLRVPQPTKQCKRTSVAERIHSPLADDFPSFLHGGHPPPFTTGPPPSADPQYKVIYR